MKALVLAAVLAALSSTAPAGAGRDAQPQAVTDTATATLIADASRLGSTSLTALSSNRPWAPAQGGAAASSDFGGVATEVDTGTLLIGLGALALGLARPLGRALRRQEQQRRAAALASTLGHAQHG